MTDIIDFHCDTLMKIFDLYKQGDTSQDIWSNDGQIALDREVEAGYAAQFFACYLWWIDKPLLGSHYHDALKMTELFHSCLAKHADKAAWAGGYRDYLENRKNGLVSCFLTVEEGGILEDRIERLDELFKHGIRLITLTWNFENCLGYPHCDPAFADRGLKPFGIEAIARMDELGMIVDVSHLSDGGFRDVYKYGKRPFIASHSNARAVCRSSRNLTDEMIRMLADKGGVAGLNFSGEFLSNDGVATMDAMLANIRHMMDVGGKEFVCIGTDFDGIEDIPAIAGCQDMQKLPEAMSAAGFTDDEVEGVCYRNAEKFFKRFWEES